VCVPYIYGIYRNCFSIRIQRFGAREYTGIIRYTVHRIPLFYFNSKRLSPAQIEQETSRSRVAERYRVKAQARCMAEDHYLEMPAPATDTTSANDTPFTAPDVRQESIWLASLCSFPSPQPIATPRHAIVHPEGSRSASRWNSTGTCVTVWKVAPERRPMRHLLGGGYVPRADNFAAHSH
jgi:hypothetical protein